MNKEQSTILKGVAILMMLWYHLFGISDLETQCSPLIYIHGKALVAYIANACYPVTFFLILSGYGLTHVYKKRKLNINKESNRLLRIYIHYWVILLIFVSIGYFIKPGFYSYNLLYIIGNMTAIRCNYNGEVWFLFPYAVICLTSPFIIRFIYHLNNKRNIIFSIGIYALLFGFAKYLSFHLPENIVLNILCCQLVYYIILIFYFIREFTL